MKLPRRKFLLVAGGAAAAPVVSRIAGAQSYPTRPIIMIVAVPAGAGADAVGRILAESMRVSLGQPVVIENVTGAAGSIGVGRVGRASCERSASSVRDRNSRDLSRSSTASYEFAVLGRKPGCQQFIDRFELHSARQEHRHGAAALFRAEKTQHIPPGREPCCRLI
jgi:hypothetical protein